MSGEGFGTESMSPLTEPKGLYAMSWPAHWNLSLIDERRRGGQKTLPGISRAMERALKSKELRWIFNQL